MSVKMGIVGYMDIMGYKELINRNSLNEIEETIHKILDFGPEVNKNVIEIMGSLFKETNHKFDPHEIEIQYNVISDSVILTKELSDSDDFHNCIRIMSIMFSLRFLNKFAIENGIAIRGAISLGDYLIENSIFASKAIINSYDISNNLEFSGIVIDDLLIDYIREIAKRDKGKITIANVINSFICRIIVPTKNGEKELTIIRWFEPACHNAIIGLRQYLIKSFSMHNKPINSNVFKKIVNTENICRIALENTIDII